MKHVLLTNDDGILATGLGALGQAASHLGQLYVVAPASPQSAAGHSVTLTDPLICQEVKLPGGLNGHSVSGRPADCVKLAMTELLEHTPDLVISGINAGTNVGVNVLYSGTVAAALEAAFFKVPAVAISLAIKGMVDFDYAASAARSALDRLIEQGLLIKGRVLNVNLPPCQVGRPKGIKFARQSTRPWTDRFHRRTDPRGRLYFWLDTDDATETGGVEQETDEHVISEGYISVTPLNLNLTDESDLGALPEQLSL